MPSFIEAVGESVNRAACVVLGDFASRLEVLNYVLDPLATAPSYNGAAAAYAARCGLPLPDDFVSPAPFTGGQCPGVSYRVTVDYTFVSGLRPGGVRTETPSQTIFNAIGKINGVTKTTTTNTTRVVLLADSGNQEGGGGSSGFNNDIDVENPRIALIEPLGGATDNCGNPPVVIPPYTPGGNTYNTNVTYNDNDNTEVTIPVVIALGYATVNIDGTISIPIRAEFNLNPELDFNADFNFSTGGLTIDLSNPSAPRTPPGTDKNPYKPEPGIPDPPPEIPDSEPPETPPETPTERERIINACIVTVGAPSENESVIFQDDNPDIYVPALGYVQFKIRVGQSSAWTADIPVKCKRQFIVCPWALGAIDVRGTGRYDIPITVTPVLSEVQLVNPFPA